ncbi:hypothetical protein K456DRAFT_1156393 [Colletotrichum gloeosporioides 23]|nr:hypothetical protein K456DRAFT_1156393 [Colletotrichum gloeosporioides 23]
MFHPPDSSAHKHRPPRVLLSFRHSRRGDTGGSTRNRRLASPAPKTCPTISLFYPDPERFQCSLIVIVSYPTKHMIVRLGVSYGKDRARDVFGADKLLFWRAIACLSFFIFFFMFLQRALQRSGSPGPCSTSVARDLTSAIHSSEYVLVLCLSLEIDEIDGFAAFCEGGSMQTKIELRVEMRSAVTVSIR